MTYTLRISTALAASVLAVLAPTPSEAAIAYTIEGGLALVRFDTASPGMATTIGNFSGAVSSVDGIDFRVSNGLLYGYSYLDNAVVTIDVNSAVTSWASTPGTASSDFILGMDFNPVVDRLRLVNASTENLRINVGTGATTVDSLLTYAVGDAHFGLSPQIGDVAYTNNDNNPGTGTQLYYIDFGTNSLATTSNPNGGVLNTVGALGVDASNLLGFDIFTDPFTGTNTAFAILDDGAASRFYTINLATGAATLVCDLGAFGVFGLAVQPAAVPEPGTALAGLAAFGACGATRLRRRRKG